jgi:hypothetical protein
MDSSFAQQGLTGDSHFDRLWPMNRIDSWRVCLSLVGGIFLSGLAEAGPKITVRDVKGRPLEIELLAADAKMVSFLRVDTAKQFSLAMETFDADSQAEILKAAAAMPAVFPKIEADVIVGKRRDKGTSYYWVEQTINCTVKLRNPSPMIAIPKVTAKILFIGRSQRHGEDYTVLKIDEFPVELKPGGNSSNVLEPFMTAYDSDNKGYGNIGGYQYSGYLMLFLDDQKTPVYNQTTDAGIRKAINDNPKILAQIVTYEKDTCLDDKMVIQRGKTRESSSRSD